MKALWMVEADIVRLERQLEEAGTKGEREKVITHLRRARAQASSYRMVPSIGS